MYNAFLILRPSVISAFTLYYVIIMIKKYKIASDEHNHQINNISNNSSVSFINKNNFTIIHTLTYIISYPLILYSGAVRLLKHEHYLISIRNSHLIELLGQTIPLLVIQQLNSTALNKPQIIDTLFLAISIVNIINILVEIFIDSHIIR